MGFSVTFAAIPLHLREAFLSAAGVGVTGETDAEGREMISASEYGDHFLIWRNLRAAPMFSEPDWNTLSKSAPVTVLDVVDTAGAQVLRHFEGGAQIWEVSFQDNNDDLLKIEGPVPESTARLKDRLRAEWLRDNPEDADEDDAGLLAGYGMELPSRVFENITGLYYEDGPPEGLIRLSNDLPQINLSWTGKPRSKPWWKFW